MQGSLPWLVRHQSKVLKAEETRIKGKMIKKNTIILLWYEEKIENVLKTKCLKYEMREN